MTIQPPLHITVALTGASGTVIAYRLIQKLLSHKVRLSIVYSKAAEMVSAQETHIPLTADIADTAKRLRTYFQTDKHHLHLYDRTDWQAPIASGSNSADAMVICPCTMGTVAAIRHGLSDDLLTRAADVIIKEQKPLILVPRESPLSAIHLENLLALSRLNVTVLPPMLTFYHQPTSIDDMINPVVERILDHLCPKKGYFLGTTLHIPNDDSYRWGNTYNETA